MTVKQFDRLRLNAAIEQLIESKAHSNEARQAVYEFGVSLSAASRVSGSLQMQTPGDSFTGFTREQGNVQVQEDQEQLKKVDFGVERARIGNYKVWKQKNRRGKFGIAIGHFWKLDEGTESTTEAPRVWRLECDLNGPIWFGERATRTVWDHFGLCLQRHEFIETWGRNVGKHHRESWAIGLEI